MLQVFVQAQSISGKIHFVVVNGPYNGYKVRMQNLGADDRSEFLGNFYQIIAHAKPGLSYLLSYETYSSIKTKKVDKPTENETPNTAEPEKPAEPVAKYVAPKCPSGVTINKGIWNFLNASLQLGNYALLLGPKGTGKSTVAEALAKANNMDFYTFDLGQAVKPKKTFVGGLIIDENGSTKFVESEFMKAFTSDKPTLIFLDELTRIPAAAANYLMTILAKNQSFIYNEDTGARVYKGKDVHFIAAGNVGMQYSGTSVLDTAFADRFVKFSLDYLSQSEEVALVLDRYPSANKSEVETLVSAANLLRKGEKAGQLSVGFSTRQVLAAASYLTLGFNVRDIIKQCYVNTYIETDETEAVNQILQSL